MNAASSPPELVAMGPDPEADDPLSAFYFLRLIEELGRTLTTEYDKRSLLSRNQTRIIVALLKKDGQTQTELAQALDLHKVSIGIYLGELEALGLVGRRPHKQDGRAKCVFLTPLLHAHKGDGAAVFEALHAAATDGIPDRDYEIMLKCMAQMKANLERLGDGDALKPRSSRES